MAIGFVPVRGGSKSIPGKNIKIFCGKPLVYWVLDALVNTEQVSEVYVATDSPEIVDCIYRYKNLKVKVYERDAKNATDDASTESVLLEFLNSASVSRDTKVILAQATNPFTTASDIELALQQLSGGEFDSLLTCSRLRRFFWSEDGQPINYDYTARPRRQDFSGELIENGAFYINSTGAIQDSKCRLSGKIAIYEMEEFTSVEIDEVSDWGIAEALMVKHMLPLAQAAKPKIVFTDVDGTLTDGGMYYDQHHNEMKKFKTKDGLGFELLRNAGYKTGIITGEDTKIVESRATKIKVDYLFMGKNADGKILAAEEACQAENLTLADVCYIGDDINCIPLLGVVGFAACPSDAHPKVKSVSGIHVLQTKGGDGAFRELAELILEANLITNSQ